MWCGPQGQSLASACGIRKWGALPALSEVVEYFVDALGECPAVEWGRSFCFERQDRFVWGRSWRRACLSGADREVRLQWWTNDDFGLSELREFFEAPFFREAETECFYRWLAQGGEHEAVFRSQRVRMRAEPTVWGVYVEVQWEGGRES
ncbi:MAG: hypothetical protein RLZZ399_2876 [Verrucomicrobiota bacterium]